MGTISTPIDLKDVVEATQEQFRNLSLGVALGEFASLHVSRSPKELRSQATKTASEHTLSHMMASSHIDEEGKVAARSAGIPFGKASEEVAEIDAVVSQPLSLMRQMTVSGIIDPARRFIQHELRPKVQHFLLLATYSPFVPTLHKRTFAIGFERFFRGDMVSAANILLPQLENSIRYVLKASGTETSTIQSDMTEDDRSLSSLLVHERGNIDKVFGEDLTYEIDLLFNMRPGPALRHEAAHGKLSDAQYFSDDVVFACWLVFRIMCLPMFPYWDAILGELDEF